MKNSVSMKLMKVDIFCSKLISFLIIFSLNDVEFKTFIEIFESFMFAIVKGWFLSFNISFF